MRYLVTGGCGFLGSNLAADVIRRCDELFVIDNMSRKGCQDNLAWLKSKGEFSFFESDTRDVSGIDRIIADIQPDVIFHLAGQVAMTTSIIDPRADFETNVLGTFNVLDAVRRLMPEAIVLYSSTNKVYGDFEWVRYVEDDTRYRAPDFPKGFDESVGLEFHSPYGCSKGAADQYCLDFARIYGLRTIVFRHSSMYGSRQYASTDQGWVGWFCGLAAGLSAGGSDPVTISGNGKQVRDVLHAEDMIRLYFSAAEAGDKIAGRAFNVGGGMDNSLSLLELFALLEGILDIEIKLEKLAARISDQKIFVADCTAIGEAVGWRPQVSADQGIRQMLGWIKESGAAE